MPEPAAAFPSINDRAAMKQRIAAMTRAAYAILGAATVALAGVAYGIASVFL
jgi:hypothetical protein